MKQKLTAALLSVALAFAASGIVCAAAYKGYVKEALEYGRMAIKAGQYGNAEKLGEYAEKALKYAKLAQEKTTGQLKEHIRNAIESIKEALEDARMGHAKKGIHHMGTALRYLRAAQVGATYDRDGER